MPSFGVTQCDVLNCIEQYTIEYDKYFGNEHPSYQWTRVNNLNLCPFHSIKIKEALAQLSLPSTK